MQYPAGVSVVMAAHNEEASLPDCLESVRSFASEIIVVDAESDDSTRAIAESYGATVITEPNNLMLNVNKNIAIDRARFEWILVLDPDERVSPKLAAEISAVTVGVVASADGYWLPRRDRELGRVLARVSPQLRLFRNGRGRFPCEHIHEMVDVEGNTRRLRAALLHEPRQSLFDYVHKRNLYSEHRARHLRAAGARFRLRRLVLRPPLAFFKTYFIHGGWRDGIPGLIIAWSAAYGTMLQDAKLWQLERSEDEAAL